MFRNFGARFRRWGCRLASYHGLHSFDSRPSGVESSLAPDHHQAWSWAHEQASPRIQLLFSMFDEFSRWHQRLGTISGSSSHRSAGLLGIGYCVMWICTYCSTTVDLVELMAFRAVRGGAQHSSLSLARLLERLQGTSRVGLAITMLSVVIFAFVLGLISMLSIILFAVILAVHASTFRACLLGSYLLASQVEVHQPPSKITRI